MQLSSAAFVPFVIQFVQQEEALFLLEPEGICYFTGLLCGLDCFVEIRGGLNFFELGSETLHQVSPENVRIRVCTVTPLNTSCRGKRYPGGSGR